MSEITRYGMDYGFEDGDEACITPKANGDYVDYADHLQALTEARRQGRMEGATKVLAEGYANWTDQDATTAAERAVVASRIVSELEGEDGK